MTKGTEPLYDLDAWLKQSAVRVGKLWFASRDVDECLRRYCKHIFRVTGMDEFPYQFPGSGTALRIDGKHLLFCCGHQLKGLDPEEIGMLTSIADNNIITGSKMLRPHVTPENEDGDIVDVCAFEYVIARYGYAHLSGEFFPVNPDRIWQPGRDGLFLVFGYPSNMQNVDYDKPQIDFRVVSIGADYNGSSASPGVHRLKLRQSPLFGADGMSGGAVFFVSRDSTGFSAEIAGLVIRGSQTSDIIHFVEASILLTFAHG